MTEARYLLFLSRNGRHWRDAERRMRAYIDDRHPDGAALDVRYVEDDIEAAEVHRVMATPLVLRESPLPRLRVVGLPEDPELLAALLDPPATIARGGRTQ